MQKEINLIFPHQLFRESPFLKNGFPFYLIEEFLFYKQYAFHKQKIAFHHASLQSYAEYLRTKGNEVILISADNPMSDIRAFLQENDEIEVIHYIDPTDNWLEQRLKKFAKKKILIDYPSPLFLNSKEDNTDFFRADKKFFFHKTFYKQQRKKYNVLLDESKSPIGGEWSFDFENRKKFPKGKMPPEINFPEKNKFWTKAISFVSSHFKDNPGSLTSKRWYPINHQEAETWLDQFLEIRFYDFGAYEDAIVMDQSILHHSLLSPLINVGLITPGLIIKKATDYAQKNSVPINSTEGFIRQIIGWREFIRGMYELKGNQSRNHNYWNFERKIPKSFYTGETGILPIDNVIKKVLQTGYCHHIERLMVLGNFMMLCEFHPDEVYRWFMELFIDAYDWVMVPNVYGMSQFADGGNFATKPYISGSNYLKKMSNYPKGEWQEIWDGLFWRFMSVHKDTFNKNPRMSMLLRTWDRMTDEKRQMHLKNAEAYIASL
jgi:deoxyribodipyrimidine photolyase-related protein